MHEEKRIFESDVLSADSLHLQSRLEVEVKNTPETQFSSEEGFSFSKEMVRRLIEWLEEK